MPMRKILPIVDAASSPQSTEGGCHQCAFYADKASIAETERDDLRKRVEELTAERDEHLQFRQSEVEKWGAEVFKAEKNLEAALYENGLLERRVSDRDREIAIVNARLDELRRVLSELVRK